MTRSPASTWPRTSSRKCVPEHSTAARALRKKRGFSLCFGAGGRSRVRQSGETAPGITSLRGDFARGFFVAVLPGGFKRASANRPCLGPAMLRQRCETWRNKEKGLWQYHNPYLLNWCRGRDSNPHSNCHYPLKIACLPVPPPRRQKRFYAKSRSLASFFFKKSGLALFFFFMAMPEVPLRAARLAKVAPCG